MSTPRGGNLSKVGKDYADRLVAGNNATEPQLLTAVTFDVPDAVTGDIDIVLATKFEVVRVDCLKKNGAGAANTMQIKNGADAISNAIACAVDNTLTSSGTIDDAYSTVAQGGTLRLTATKSAGTRDALVIVYGFVRA